MSINKINQSYYLIRTVHTKCGMVLFLDTDENIKAIKEAKEDKEIGT